MAPLSRHILSRAALDDEVTDIFLALAETCSQMLGGGSRGQAALEAILGQRLDMERSLEETLAHGRFDPSCLEGTQFKNLIGCLFEREVSPLAINTAVTDSEWRQKVSWLRHFLLVNPLGATSAKEEFGQLDILMMMVETRLSLADTVFSIFEAGEIGEPIFGREVLFFCHRDAPSVSDVAVQPTSGAFEETSVRFQRALNLIERLAQAPGFCSGGLDGNWVEEKMPGVGSVRTASAIPGLMSWLNGQSTCEMAAKLGWTPRRLTEWIYGQEVDVFSAPVVAEAAGLDGEGYGGLIRQLTTI